MSRDIDKRIAVEVFGKEAKLYEEHGCIPLHSRLPRYSTSIADAWPILDKFGFVVGPEWEQDSEKGSIRVGWAVYEHWMNVADDLYSMPGSSNALAIDESLPMAICKAALKAVEGK